MSLIDALLTSPGPEDRLMQVLPLIQGPRPSGPGGMPGGMPGAGGAPRELALDIGAWIDGLPGFSVGGLEGYNGMGQISSGHIENSQHYSGMAGDVSYNGGGRFGNEMAALDWLNRRLQKRYGDALTELLWRVPNHFDHLHYGTRPGG